MDIRKYISSVRVDSLLLSVSGLLLGSMMAAADYHINWWVVVLMALSVTALQVCTVMLPGILLAIGAVWLTYGTVFKMEALLTLLMAYFVYKMVYNHSPEKGLFRNGIVVTLSCLLIYGLIPVYGAYFVCTHSFARSILLLPSLSVGALCLAAVNSDYLEDGRTRFFHILWIMVGFASMTVYACMRIFDIWHFLFLLMLPVFAYRIISLSKRKETAGSDKLRLAVSIVLFALMSGAGFLVYLF